MVQAVRSEPGFGAEPVISLSNPEKTGNFRESRPNQTLVRGTTHRFFRPFLVDFPMRGNREFSERIGDRMARNGELAIPVGSW